MRVGIRVEGKPVKTARERVGELAKSLVWDRGIEKARNRSRLVLRYTTDKNGHKTKRWVSPEDAKKLDEKAGKPKQAGNGKRNGGSFVGSVAVGDLITGEEARTGKGINGKVTAKGRDGITVLTEAGTTHYVEWGGLETVDQLVSDQDAIRMLYDKKAIKGGWRNGDDELQPESCDTIDGLLKAAGAAREDFNTFSAGYVKRFRALDPVLIKRPVLKGVERIKEKLRDDDDHGECFEPPDTYHARTIRDTDGHTFTLNSVADVGKMLAAFDKDKHIVRIKNNFAEPSNLGYSDINMNIRLPNGTIAEIQLNTTANIVAKERYGHSLYEVHRSLKDKPGYKKLAGVMEEAQKALYGLSNKDSREGEPTK